MASLSPNAKAISWQFGRLQTGASANGAAASSWADIDIPKQGTTELSSEKGDTQEALDEAGNVVALTSKKNKVTLTFTCFVKTGVAAPFTDEDGVIKGEHSFRFQPQNAEADGFQIDRAAVTCTTTFKVEDGLLRTYEARALVPAAGAALKIQKITIG